MKICFVTNGDIISNANIKRATGMANYFIDEGWSVSIVIQDTKNNRDRLQIECPKVEPLFFNECGVLTQLSQKKQLLNKWQPDIVYVCAPSIRNFINKFNTGLKNSLFIILHSELFSSAKIGLYKRARYYFFEILTLFLYDGHIAVSRYLEKYYSKKMKTFGIKKPILYSPDAYNVDYKNLIYKDLRDLFPEKKIILYMGSLSLNYGFLELIQAVEKIKKEINDFVLIILGDGNDRKVGENFVENHNLSSTVFFFGHIFEKDLYSYLNIADVFVCPLNNTVQDWSRCPSKLYMYLPFEKPIVTCRIGEALELFGENGYYYNPNNIDDFALVLKSVLDLDKPRYEIDITRHTWKYSVKLFMEWINLKFNKYE